MFSYKVYLKVIFLLTLGFFPSLSTCNKMQDSSLSFYNSTIRCKTLYIRACWSCTLANVLGAVSQDSICNIGYIWCEYSLYLMCIQPIFNAYIGYIRCAYRLYSMCSLARLYARARLNLMLKPNDLKIIDKEYSRIFVENLSWSNSYSCNTSFLRV